MISGWYRRVFCLVEGGGVGVVIYDFRLVQEGVLFGGGGVAVVIYDFRLVQECFVWWRGGSSSYL